MLQTNVNSFINWSPVVYEYWNCMKSLCFKQSNIMILEHIVFFL